MRKSSPFGSSLDWVTSSDLQFAPRGLSAEEHDELAILAVGSDTPLMHIEKKLGHKVILAVAVGKYNLHVRIYNHNEVLTRPDRLASRLLNRDDSTFLHFGSNGQLELVEGDWRMLAQGHSPEIYATLRFSSFRQRQMDNFQVQITNRPIGRLGIPKPDAPLEEEVVDLYATEPPTLEPVTEDCK